jgi:oligopeptide/dipeptide ABC transporter ATP-binding protein
VTTPLLSVEHLTVGFRAGDRYLDLVHDVSLDVQPGEIVALVGESGSGKTITARAAMGLLRRNPRMRVEGRISLLDKELLGLSDSQIRDVRGREIGMIFQDPVGALDPVMTVGDQVREAVRRRHKGHGLTRKRVLELLEQVGITDPELRLKQFPHEISGGMCQRVLIATAIAGDPALLIADEPTTALDVTIQAQVLELLKRLRDERGMSMLLITHDMGVAAQTADRILVMYGGSLVEEGRIEDFFDQPYHPYSVGLISAVPRVDVPRSTRLPAIPGSVPEAAHRPSGCLFHPRCPVAVATCATAVPPLRAVGSRLVACVRAEDVRAGVVRPWAEKSGVA